MAPESRADIEIVCPCCGAELKIDTSLGKVIAHGLPQKPHPRARDLDGATRVLEKQAARREALFRQSSEEEKVKSQLLDRKFEEALKKSKGEPASKPTREIDLD